MRAECRCRSRLLERGALFVDLLIHQFSAFLMEINTKIYPNLIIFAFQRGARSPCSAPGMFSRKKHCQPMRRRSTMISIDNNLLSHTLTVMCYFLLFCMLKEKRLFKIVFFISLTFTRQCPWCSEA